MHQSIDSAADSTVNVCPGTRTLSWHDRTWVYLQLIRPANIVTAWADILAGSAASGGSIAVNSLLSPAWTPVLSIGWLLLATTGLYAGGIVLNDYFDAEQDAQERPERLIPSGRVLRQNALLLGSGLLAIGVLAASQVSMASTMIALFIAAAVLLYNQWSKRYAILGCLNMGICRGGNLLLGMSVVPSAVLDRAYLAVIPILYIAAITAISRGEERGGQRWACAIALVLLLIALVSVAVLGVLINPHWLLALPLWGLLVVRVVPSFIQAVQLPQPELIQAAVSAGVLSLIVLDASIAASFAGGVSGLLVLGLLPFSSLLARWFAVT
jgi:4-hydroxybenzoate polyprenyltransferase